jgi:hypothetical protein
MARHVMIGDVLCTRSSKGLAGRLIRLGAALQDQPDTVNHVVIVHHRDRAGTLWGIEGRPGGVGWVDCARYLRGPYTLDNGAQQKTAHQRAQVCKAAAGLIGTPYDWTGIALDAMQAIDAPALWADRWKGQVPAHVVCSSLADWVYEHVGLASPDPDRTCTPADWAEFIIEKGWRR